MTAFLAFMAMQATVPQVPLADVVLPPSRAVRDRTLRELQTPPATASTYRFICRVANHGGVPVNCLPSGKKVASLAEYDAEMERHPPAKTALSPVEIMAMMRVLSARVRPRDRTRNEQVDVAVDDGLWTLQEFVETVSPGDRVDMPASSLILPLNQVTVASAPESSRIMFLYPSRALRFGVEARVRVVCRIVEDRSLFCLDGQITSKFVTSDKANDDGFALDFILASYQAASLFRIAPELPDGSNAVGKDVVLNFNWKVPS